MINMGLPSVTKLFHELPTMLDLKGKDTRLPDELSLRARFARGAFWSLCGSVVARGLAFASSVLVARMLGAEGFGQLGMVQSTVGMFGVFAGFGMGLTATKFVAQYRKSDPGRAGRIIGLTLAVSAVTGFVMAVALFFSADWLATTTLNAPQLGPLLQIGAAYMLLSAMNGAQNGALAGFEAYRTIMWRSIIGAVVQLPLMVALAWYFGVTGAVVALALGGVVAWAVTGWGLKQEARKADIKIDSSGLKQEYRTLWNFTVPATTGSMISMPALWVTKAMLANTPDGMKHVGGFVVATQLQALLVVLPGLLFTSAFPVLSSEFAKGNISNYRRTKNIMMLGTLILAGIPAAVIIMLSRPILALYGPEFTEFALVIQVYMLGSLIYSVNLAQGQSILASHRAWLRMTTSIAWTIVLLSLAWGVVPRYQGVGLAASFTIAYLVHMLLQAYYIHRIIRQRLAPNAEGLPSNA